MVAGSHIPVLLQPVLDLVAPRSGGCYLDATLGGGGAAEALLERSAPDGILFGIDRDGAAVAAVGECLARFGARAHLVTASFSELDAVLERERFDRTFDGIVADLGLSSVQLDDPERGFSFRFPDAPLDMRFDPRGGTCAADLLNELPLPDLAKLLREFGQERLAQRIAVAIVDRRKRVRFTRVGELVETVLAVYRSVLHSKRDVPWVGGLHPATRTFQALRIAVNAELEQLSQFLASAISHLASGGRIAVISFHSLEDRIVKNVFRDEVRQRGRLTFVTKKPVVPEPDELAANPRAAPAKLRVAERTSTPQSE